MVTTATKFMQVADTFGGDKYKPSLSLDGLTVDASALYALSAPSVPEPARIEAVAASFGKSPQNGDLELTIDVADRFGSVKLDIMSNLDGMTIDATALFALSAPSTPEPARVEAVAYRFSSSGNRAIPAAIRRASSCVNGGGCTTLARSGRE